MSGAAPVTADRLRAILGEGPRDLLAMEDVAREYHFPTPEAARKFVRRYVPFNKRGRRLLVDRRDFEAAMTQKRRTRK